MTDLHNLDAERAILGACILTSELVDVLASDLQLRPAHFHGQEHGWIFAAMTALRDQDRQVDPVTVCQQANDHGHRIDRQAVDELSLHTPVAGNVREYGRIVLELAMWRHRLAATGRMQQAAIDRDQSAFDQAEALIATSDRADTSTSSPEDLASDMFDWLNRPATDIDAITTPFRKLNELLHGGLRAGDVTLIAAWSSMGKSVLVDQLLEHAAGKHRVRLYINEMSRRDRFARRLARHSGVKFGRIMNRQCLEDTERRDLARTMELLPPVPITDVSGWAGSDIARHIRRHRPEFCAVDLLNLIPHEDGQGRHSRVAQVDAISATLNAAARQTGCHVLLVCQLNQERNKGARFPRPVRRDIRESGQLASDATNVLLVHRDQAEVPGAEGAEMFELLNDGSIWFDKARNSQLGGLKVTFDPDRMRFLPTVGSGLASMADAPMRPVGAPF